MNTQIQKFSCLGRRSRLLLAVFSLLVVTPAFGEDPVFDLPSWFPGDTYKQYRFNWEKTPPDPPKPVLIDEYAAGYPMSWNVQAGSQDLEWIYRLTIDNREDLKKVKNVYLGYSFFANFANDLGIAGPIADNFHGTTGGMVGGKPPKWTVESDTGHQLVDANRRLYKRVIEWTISPQPAQEWLEWRTLGVAKLDAVIAMTICVPEPKPYALLVAGLAVLGISAARGNRTTPHRGAKRISDPCASKAAVRSG